MKRSWRLLFIPLLVVGACTSLSADALEDIDRAVSELGNFLLQTIPDRPEQNLTILAFLSDEYGRVTLGDRLRSELELYLAAEYKRLRIIPQPEGDNTYTVSGELQTYPGRVRIICRITRPDGSLGGGTRVDIPSSPELISLLEPSGIVQPGSEGIQSPGGGWVDQDIEDPFEPDDAPGFEVQVPSFGTQRFGRSITPGDVDRFRFYKAESGTVVLEAQTEIDLQLLLFREGENIPFEVSGSEGFANVRLETTLEEGYYVAELLAYDFSIQGPYVFSVDLTGMSNDSFEPDNRFDDARAINPDTQQDRALLSGDQDWVELSFTIPDFYAVYTTGPEVDTRITLYSEQKREILADDNSGIQDNAFIPLFLGTRRIYARITGEGPLGSGAYTLVFEKFDPVQIFPGSGIAEIEVGENPMAFKLRIIQSGRYLVRSRGDSGGAMVAVELFSLPSMRSVQGADSLYNLSAGDYLFILKSNQVQRIRYCIAPEAAGEDCLRLIQE
ncbi:MAG: hypothetical protein JSV89_18885 [Spirochaetaceae bacterium]|nr:MAG: hypothetical protein JSV89_18885 [Spirochaetaceae bacterium]